jgi:hypothetical protein
MTVSTYHLYASAATVGADTYGSATSAKFTIKSLRFWDGFDYGSTDAMLSSGRWSLRQTEYDASSGRSLQRADARAVEVANNQLRLKAVPDPDYPGCVLVGHVTTGILDFVRGHISARVKFERPKGAHGAVWHQSGYGPGGAELDVVEFFGERGGSHITDPTAAVWTQKVQHTVYTGDGSGGITQYGRVTYTDNIPSTEALPAKGGFAPNNDDTWWTQFHTYEAFWNGDGYRFYIDDIYVGSRLDAPAATVPGELILSLLVSDGGEHNAMDDMLTNKGYDYSDYVMYVDWVRVWR